MSAGGQGTCIVIPAYNATASLRQLLPSACAHHLPVLVVDDGSTDGTAEIAAACGARVLRQADNRGKGAALRAGFAEALRLGYDAVLTMDADGQHAPSDIPQLLAAAMTHPEAGLIIGNRMTNARAMPWVRRATNRVMSWWLSRRAGQHVPDTQCGFRLMRRSLLERCQLQSAHFEVESEMLLEAARLGAGIISVPVRTVYAHERSHISPWRDTWRFLQFMTTYRRGRDGF